MFGFVQWDSPIALLLEVVFALAVFIVIFWVVRRVEKGERRDVQSALPLQPPNDADMPLGAVRDPSPRQEQETGNKDT